MTLPDSPRYFRIFLYGSGTTLLLLDLLLLFKSLITDNYVPIVPILAGILTAAGLLFIISAEKRTRADDKVRHRRITLVAYQLESPLHHLRSDLDRLLKDAGQLPAEHRLQIRRLETSAAVLLDNIRDVFLMLRALEGQISQDIRTYDLCQLLQEVYQRAQPLAKAHNVQLIYQTHCSKALVKVDRQLFFLALRHLIENGLKYTLKPGQVNLAIIKGAKFCRIVVQDRGIGIKTPDDQAAVFEPFARGDNAAQYDPDGIGVGLALTSLILREVGGTIGYRHKSGGLGTEFTIKLPLVVNH